MTLDWTSVQEALPLSSTVYTIHAEKFAYLGWNGREVITLDSYYGFWPTNVTHWMELPGAPDSNPVKMYDTTLYLGVKKALELSYEGKIVESRKVLSSSIKYWQERYSPKNDV